MSLRYLKNLPNLKNTNYYGRKIIPKVEKHISVKYIS